MNLSVLRIGQRIVRDDRVTTHAALVARAFGASKIFMSDINPEIVETVEAVSKRWGGSFEVEPTDSWRGVLASAKKRGDVIVHLTMYGSRIGDVAKKIAMHDSVMVVIGAEKVPRDVYDMADYNVSVGSQPHSEIAALAVVLDRVQEGKQFDAEFENAEHKIVPTERGKNVV